MIHFIDLKKQQKKIRQNIDKRISKVLNHGKYIMGPEVIELEERLAEYVGSKYCAFLSNGLDALTLSLMSLDVKEGDLVIWDSRTFHQNTCGPPDCNEERLIQYLCYLPKNSENNDAMQNKLRKTFFNTKRTTSHWPYPMNCVPLQPVMYNHYYAKTVEDLVYIDYEKLENIVS